jgi:hypothetical protein
MYYTQPQLGNEYSSTIRICPSYRAYFRLTPDSRLRIFFPKQYLTTILIQQHFGKSHFEMPYPLEVPAAILLKLGIESYKIHSGLYAIKEDRNFITVDF